ncbi:Hypothetical_protein [Hexamita inflata]|uniref:Hypothetical_protein n=1 Tax=Hexamita inflata TaxID=28002 RepID=A0AA86P820_9EUKA|nr:Hypothetical protein HINF_LOCUS21073 [Hexamita inflata]
MQKFQKSCGLVLSNELDDIREMVVQQPFVDQQKLSELTSEIVRIKNLLTNILPVNTTFNEYIEGVDNQTLFESEFEFPSSIPEYYMYCVLYSQQLFNNTYSIIKEDVYDKFVIKPPNQYMRETLESTQFNTYDYDKFPKTIETQLNLTQLYTTQHNKNDEQFPTLNVLGLITKVAARNYTRPKKWPFCQTRVNTARVAFRDCVIMAHATFSAARLVGKVACSIIYIRECSQRNECCDGGLELGFLSSTLQQKMRRADLVMIWMYIIRQYTFWNVVQKMRLIQKVIGFCNVTNSTMITIQIRPWYINIIAGHVLRDRMQPHRPSSQSPEHHMRIDDSVGPTIKSVVSATSALKYAHFSVFEIWMVFSAS